MKMMSTNAYRRAVRAANQVKAATNKRRAQLVCIESWKKMFDQSQQEIKRAKSK